MVVNSLGFLWFFLFVVVVYYLCQTKKEVQNVFYARFFHHYLSWSYRIGMKPIRPHHPRQHDRRF